MSKRASTPDCVLDSRPAIFTGWRAGTAFALLFFAASLPGAAADTPLPRISVEDAAFTPSIADRQPAQRIATSKPGEQPFFWTKLSANQTVLDTLRAEGKLPIRHTWFQSAGPAMVEEIDLSKLNADIPLDLGTAALSDQLQREIDQSPQRAFTWRTWSRKGALASGSWSVFLKYADGTPVICQIVNGVNIPCIYHLDVAAP